MITIDYAFLLIATTCGVVVHLGLSYDVYVSHVQPVCSSIASMAHDVYVVSSCRIG